MKDFFNYQIRGRWYRFLMRLAHRHGWHYMPPVFPGGDIQYWCQWCGIRDTFDGNKYFLNSKTGLTEMRESYIKKIHEEMSTPTPKGLDKK